MNLYGMSVFESDDAMATTSIPARIHRKSKGSKAYHERIQKKWLKRFGYLREPAIYQTSFGLMVHPALMPRIRYAMTKRSPIQPSNGIELAGLLA